MPLILTARISLGYRRLKLVRLQHGLNQLLSQHDKIDEINASARTIVGVLTTRWLQTQLLKDSVRSWGSSICQIDSASSSSTKSICRELLDGSVDATCKELWVEVACMHHVQLALLELAASIFRYDGPK